jgi:hypothetical protein
LDQFKGILEPLDEIKIWEELENETGNAVNEKLRKNAEIINKHFATVQKQFVDLEKASLGTVTGYIDSIEDCLGNIWTDPDIFPYYPQKRMENTFRVISKAFGSRIEREFKESDVW